MKTQNNQYNAGKLQNNIQSDYYIGGPKSRGQQNINKDASINKNEKRNFSHKREHSALSFLSSNNNDNTQQDNVIQDKEQQKNKLSKIIQQSNKFPQLRIKQKSQERQNSSLDDKFSMTKAKAQSPKAMEANYQQKYFLQTKVNYKEQRMNQVYPKSQQQLISSVKQKLPPHHPPASSFECANLRENNFERSQSKKLPQLITNAQQQKQQPIQHEKTKSLPHLFTELTNLESLLKNQRDNSYTSTNNVNSQCNTSRNDASQKDLLKQLLPEKKKPQRQQLTDEEKEKYFQENAEKYRLVQIEQGKNKEELLRKQQETDQDYQKEQRLKRQVLNNNSFYNNEDAEHKPAFGAEAVQNYYKHFKQLDKVQDQNNFYQNLPSIQTAVLSAINNKKLMPKKLGLFKNEETTEVSINVSNYGLGDKQANIVAEGIKFPDFKLMNKIFMAKNRITQSSAVQICKNISANATELDFRGNSIGLESCEVLAGQLSSQNLKLIFINLENNNLGDPAIQVLMKALRENSTVRRLNISNNDISQEACQSIQLCLEENETLEELYMFWNKIGSQGGILIAEGLQKNSVLTVLDLSNNNMGNSNVDGESECAKKIAQLINFEDSNLLHIDLSLNHFNLKESQIIAQSLNKNHKIYGFHFSGNKGVVDAEGFLVFPPVDLNSWHTNQRIDGTKPILKNQNYNSKENILVKDVCWICEGWEERVFTWSSASDFFPDKVYIHLDYLQYRPIEMQQDNNPFNDMPQFQITVMLPPNSKVFYFFTIPSKLKYDFLKNHSIANLRFHQDQEPIKNYFQYVPDEPAVQFPSQIYLVNYTKTIQHQIIDEDSFQPNVNQCYPRPIYYIKPVKVKQKKIWSMQGSIWKHFTKDEEPLTSQCFEQDFKYSHISKQVTNSEELRSVKIILKNNYKQICQIYRAVASQNPNNGVWSITSNHFNTILSNLNLIEGKKFSSIDGDLLFYTINNLCQNDFKNNLMVPDRVLIRYQFMEAIFKVAQIKYMNSGRAQTYAEALQMMFSQEGMQLAYSQLEYPQQWRYKRYWNEECENVLLTYWIFLKALFTFSIDQEKFLTYKKEKFMLLKEFKHLVSSMGLPDLPERMVSQIYNYSLQQQIDEVISEKHLQMHFIEFLEAVTRIAEQVSLLPQNLCLEDKSAYEEMLNLETSSRHSSQQSSANIPLFQKIEGLIQYIYLKLPIEQMIAQNFQLQNYFANVFERKGIKRQNAFEIISPLIQQKKNRLKKQATILINAITSVSILSGSKSPKNPNSPSIISKRSSNNQKNDLDEDSLKSERVLKRLSSQKKISIKKQQITLRKLSQQSSIVLQSELASPLINMERVLMDDDYKEN